MSIFQMHPHKAAQDSRSRTKNLIERWIHAVQRHPLPVVVVAVLLTLWALFYSVRNFSINTDLNSMISETLRFRQLENDFSKAFPQMSDTIVIVLDGDTIEQALSARRRMAELLGKETRLFRNVSAPGAGSFWEKNGLLYLDVKDLENLADKLADAQPLLGFLSKDLSLRGLFSVLGMALSSPEFAEMPAESIDLLFAQMGRTFEGVASGRPYRISWQELMLGGKEAAEQRRQFIVLRPYLEENGLSPGEEAIDAVRRIARELNIDPAHGVTLRITGDVALSLETLKEARNTMGAATLVSFVLVGLVLFLGFGRSGRLVFAGLTTLAIGLIWTTGLALAFYGSLNMISITFAVLFIGLGIDYSIQFCLR
ncbi:MAG: MMPL family transporter, partial [Nitrospirae bacterium]|nr:MMPL family transporter [Nitrospirota bacterium]